MTAYTKCALHLIIMSKSKVTWASLHLSGRNVFPAMMNSLSTVGCWGTFWQVSRAKDNDPHFLPVIFHFQTWLIQVFINLSFITCVWLWRFLLGVVGRKLNKTQMVCHVFVEVSSYQIRRLHKGLSQIFFVESDVCFSTTLSSPQRNLNLGSKIELGLYNIKWTS